MSVEMTPYSIYVFDMYKLYTLNYSNLYTYVGTLVVVLVPLSVQTVEIFKGTLRNKNNNNDDDNNILFNCTLNGSYLKVHEFGHNN